MDKPEYGMGRKRFDDSEKKTWKTEDDLNFEAEDNETSKQNRKNPSSMSVRGAKRIWFSPRKSGRPSKDISDKLEEAKKVLEAAGEPLKRVLIRKSKSEGPKRPRGRPKKPIGLIKEKRPRGRPRKNPSTLGIDRPKRPRGRPRKHLLDPTKQRSQRPRGRPRKNPSQPDEDSEAI